MFVILTAAAAINFAACKDDDSEDTFTAAPEAKVDETVQTHGVETDMKSAVLGVPVECEGDWHATINRDARWVRIEDWQVTYSGNQTLTLLFDENLSKADRKTSLNITDGDGNVKHITVSQYYNYEGQPLTNGNGLSFADKGLGTGIDYDYALNMKLKDKVSEFEPTKLHGLTNILNMTRIEQLKSQGKLQQSAYVEAVIPVADLKAKLLDSSLAQSKTIKVALDLGVEFGAISVNCHGEYNSEKFENRAHVDYTIVRNCPMFNAYVSPAELSAYAINPKNNKIDFDADDAAFEEVDAFIEHCKKVNERQIRRGTNLEVNAQGLTADQLEEVKNMEANIPVRYDHAGIYSTNFNDSYNQLYNAIIRPANQGKAIDETEVNAIINVIDNNYGPFIIAGGDYGGAMSVYCQIDTTTLKGAAKFGGKISAEFAGLFNFEGELEYTEDGLSVYRNFDMKFDCFGGDANNTADKLMRLITSGNATDLEQWQSTMRNWIEGMEGEEEGVMRSGQYAPAPISYTITPIWTFFGEPKIQEYVQKYFMDKYADRGIKGYFDIMNGESKTGAETILNKNSDFWKK